ncbi:hypothetical protein DASC09_015170 [Saccharomycopsis crataegensis]|uniref:Uncharacterized protein n=1 Tax=Saccharomycopsis crataegensis TaxID=43959 RepID=A0AAV5QHU8_9ASCO|nr:hypothetical protein DASC09_015170 [Saccharomycopsis crataegensis]
MDSSRFSFRDRKKTTLNIPSHRYRTSSSSSIIKDLSSSTTRLRQKPSWNLPPFQPPSQQKPSHAISYTSLRSKLSRVGSHEPLTAISNHRPQQPILPGSINFNNSTEYPTLPGSMNFSNSREQLRERLLNRPENRPRTSLNLNKPTKSGGSHNNNFEKSSSILTYGNKKSNYKINNQDHGRRTPHDSSASQYSIPYSKSHNPDIFGNSQTRTQPKKIDKYEDENYHNFTKLRNIDSSMVVAGEEFMPSDDEPYQLPRQGPGFLATIASKLSNLFAQPTPYNNGNYGNNRVNNPSNTAKLPGELTAVDERSNREESHEKKLNSRQLNELMKEEKKKSKKSKKNRSKKSSKLSKNKKNNDVDIEPGKKPAFLQENSHNIETAQKNLFTHLPRLTQTIADKNSKQKEKHNNSTSNNGNGNSKKRLRSNMSDSPSSTSQKSRADTNSVSEKDLQLAIKELQKKDMVITELNGKVESLESVLEELKQQIKSFQPQQYSKLPSTISPPQSTSRSGSKSIQNNISHPIFAVSSNNSTQRDPKPSKIFSSTPANINKADILKELEDVSFDSNPNKKRKIELVNNASPLFGDDLDEGFDSSPTKHKGSRSSERPKNSDQSSASTISSVKPVTTGKSLKKTPTVIIDEFKEITKRIQERDNEAVVSNESINMNKDEIDTNYNDDDEFDSTHINETLAKLEKDCSSLSPIKMALR